jgi:prophage tail gpP-like protein
MPLAWEVATLIVNGVHYKDWLSVEVIWEAMSSSMKFRFTCSEGVPLVKNFAEMRIRPGDPVSITLAGQPAIENGMVLTRQVAYTATHHGIEITGISRNGLSKIASANTKTGEFKNAGFMQIANKLYSLIGCQVKQIGPINNSPFERFCVPPGETIWGAVEQLARMRGIVMDTALDGNPTAGSGGGSGDPLLEGVNILEGREVLSIQDGANPSIAIGQHGGSDQNWGAKIAHMPFSQQANQLMSMFGSGGYMARTTVSELPGMMADAGIRSGFENTKRVDEQAVVTITVQGWVMSNGSLWPNPQGGGAKLFVDSPMLIMNEMLKLKKVTFTQDSRSGTRTTLELVREVVAAQQPSIE